MLPVSVSVKPAVVDSGLAPVSSDCFVKDGRKIFVGDCALFKPPKDSPACVGIIHKLIITKEDNFNLSVSWFYRPVDIKLGKGILLEAEPNELFYSFHKVETPATSLLHPCKVAFLPKGDKLPYGISSFVCKRVYDSEEKCLWWLTDKDNIKERLKEVDQLIDRTRLEMYGAVQPGGRSPKTLSGPQLKPSSDSAQNSSSSYHSQAKGKKREVVVQGSDSVKQERTYKADDADSGQLRADQMLKHEIAKITDRGGLTDFEGVEKLVQLMQPDSTVKKLDLACRVLLANVIAVTDRFDCLTRFVQLRGLPILDDWLQQVHKRKLGENSSPKEGDKSVDEFLLAMLRALDKLPVNLHALQTCNIGKSVNHLRTNRNSEIQKKARSLVDTWKKRVEAEMNMIDAKSGSSRGASWPTKSVNSEVSSVGGCQNGEQTEPGVMNSNIQCGVSKISSAKFGSSDKLSVGSPGTTKHSPSMTAPDISTKDLTSAAFVAPGSSDAPLTTIKENKSNDSSQTQNNSQSCSSDYGKAVSVSEEAKSLTAGTLNNKLSIGISRNSKSSNGHHGTTVQGIHKENSDGKLSCGDGMSPIMLCPTKIKSEKTPDAHHVDNGNNKRLIVRFPNTARNSAFNASGGSLEDVSATSSKSPPLMQVDELASLNGNVKVGTESLESSGAVNIKVVTNQGQDGVRDSEDTNMSSGGFHGDESRGGQCSEKLTEPSKATCSPSKNSAGSGKSYEALFSSMNALVDSCVKISEQNVTESIVDDIGMNLLASVAAGEISRSDVSPSGSSGRKSSVPEESCSGNDIRLRRTDEIRGLSEDRHKEVSNGGAMRGHVSFNDCLQKPISKCTDADLANKLCMDNKASLLGGVEKNTDRTAALDTISVPVSVAHDKTPELVQEVSAANSSENNMKEVNVSVDGVDQDQEPQKPSHATAAHNNVSNSKVEGITNDPCKLLKVNGVLSIPAVAIAGANVDAKANEESPSCSSSDRRDNDNKTVDKLSGMCENTIDAELPCLPSTVTSREPEAAKDARMMLPKQSGGLSVGSLTVDRSLENSHENSDKKYVGFPTKPLVLHVQESEPPIKSSGYRPDVAEEFGCMHNLSSVPAAVSDMTVKLDFDLNEGLPVDDGSSVEPVKLPAPAMISSITLPCPLPVSNSSTAEARPFVTVASAAKGPFVPPENPLRIKGELGWRGSAATSAFRPAEPRKIPDMPLCTVSVPVAVNSSSRQGRPVLDFDLNIPDQRTLEDGPPQKPVSTCSETIHSGLDLDLNRCDDSPELGHFSASRPEIPRGAGGSSLSRAESNMSRDFDLNDGPGPDEVGIEAAPHAKNGMPFRSLVPAVTMNNMELGNFSWFPPGASYSALAMPPILPGRGDQNYLTHPTANSQRVMIAPGNTSFNPDLYRGPVLSSSPAVGYTSSTPFQYSGFPFETNFPLSSNSYSGVSTPYTDSSLVGPHRLPAIPSQLMGPTGMVSTQYSRPFIMSLPGSTSNVLESKQWGNQGLDLNAGLGLTELDRRDERLPSSLRQIPHAASQALPDEQLKMYQQMAGGIGKRKEPEGGWDGDRTSYKHPPWK